MENAMKRRIVTIIMTLCLLLSVLPCECFAQSEGQSASTYVTRSVSLPSAAQSDPAMDMMYYFGGAGRENTVTAPRLGAIPLSDTMQAIYNELVPHLKSIADGTAAMTTVTLTGFSLEFTKQELGVDALLVETAPGSNQYALTSEAYGAVEAKLGESLDLDALFAHLLAELPYELYWLDKNVNGAVSVRYGLSASERGEEGSVTTSLTFEFAVAREYIRLYEGEGGTYTYNISPGSGNPCEVDAAKVQRAKAAAAAAAEVVTANKDKGVYETLTAYKNYICGAVSYDDAAADKENNTPYGNPWQLVSVFDGDGTTNVVCEGYSKAFKYLCDLTDWPDSPAVQCYLVSGVMTGGTGAGNHMWNVVTIGGKNYLADVTNCDTGSVGAGGKLFLCGAAGSAAEGYTVTVGKQDIAYDYDEDTLAVYDTELVLSAEDFDPNAPVERPVGDLDGNYKRDVTDMARLFEHLGGEKPLEGEDLACADVNGDGEVNILDYQALYEAIKQE